MRAFYILSSLMCVTAVTAGFNPIDGRAAMTTSTASTLTSTLDDAPTNAGAIVATTTSNST